MFRKNFHTHNEICGHATGTLEDYVKKAISLGFTDLGMTEHAPFPGDAFSNRMAFEELSGYLDECFRLKEVYKDDISIRVGLEAEYLWQYDGYYDWLLNSKGVEYLILGQHYYMDESGYITWLFNCLENGEQAVGYANSVVRAMKTGYFSYVAHPDLYYMSDIDGSEGCAKADEILIDAAVSRGYILELNANGIRRGIRSFSTGDRYPYTDRLFWDKLKGTDIRVIVGSDAHDPEWLYDDSVKGCLQLAKDNKLNLVEDYID